MARQLALQTTDAAPLADPWTEERKARPGKTLVRVIDLRKRLQAFLDRDQFLSRREDEPRDTAMRTEFGAGITVVYRAPGSAALETREFDALVADWDDAWRAEQ